MADASAAPAAPSNNVNPPTTEAPKDAAPPPEAKPDPKAELNERLRAAGVKLKAKDREYVPKDIDDLVGKAQRVYGLETELERFKAEKSEADSIKQWKAAIEADDDAAAERAFDALSPKAKHNAAKWLQKQAAQYEQEQQLSPEAREYKRQMEEREAKLREYETREAKQREEAEKVQRVQRLREAHTSTLKVAGEVIKGLKASDKVAPVLVPLVARHMRVAFDAAAATGEPVDEAQVMREVADNVRSDVLEQFATVAGGMDDEALFEAMGPDVAKRIARVLLKRRGTTAPTAAEAQRATGTEPKREPPKRDPLFGTPGYFR